MRIAFLGGGNMANALIGGLLAKGEDARAISVIELSPAARERVAGHGVRVSTAPDAATGGAEVLVLAVKPQDMRRALASLGGFSKEKLVVSIAAGIRLESLSRWLGGHRRLVRCMPNTPALIGAGISALYAPPEVGAEDRDRAARVLAGASFDSLQRVYHDRSAERSADNVPADKLPEGYAGVLAKTDSGAVPPVVGIGRLDPYPAPGGPNRPGYPGERSPWRRRP